MSYTPYSSTPPTAGQTATPGTYAYGAYPYSHPQTPGTYSYPAGAYQAGVTGYGWTYPYSYVPQLPQAPRTQGVVQTPVTPYIPSATTSTPQRPTTFTSYAPTYAKENVSSSTQTAAGRGGRRQSNLKGLFTKELKNLMYGFGDDRNPANDTVSVMEEILIEYITDVCQSAAGPTRKSRLSVDDLRRVLSKPADAKKLARMEELLFMQEDIKRARAQFEESDIHN